MKLGVRGRLFLISLVVLGVVGMAGALALELQMRHWLSAEYEVTLTQKASAVAAFTRMDRGATQPRTPAEWKEFSQELAATMDVDIAVYGNDGRLLGTSEESATDDDPAVLADLERAQQDAPPRAELRYDPRSNAAELVVAVRAQTSSRTPIILRLSQGLRGMDEAISDLRLLLIIAAIAALLLAAAMSAVASQILSRAYREVVDKARSLMGVVQRTHEVDAGDDLTVLSASLDKLALETQSLLAELGSERNRMAAILDGMSDGVIAIDRRGQLLLMNLAAREILEAHAVEPGAAVEETVRIPRLVELAHRALDGLVHTEEVEVAGSSERVLVAHTAQPRPGGGAIMVLWDVTRLRQLERIRRDFVANVSHELRTPVAVVSANIELLLDSEIPKGSPGRSLGEAIMRHAERMRRLVEDLLTLSRIEAGKYELQPLRVSLRRHVDEARYTVEDLAKRKGIDLQTALSDEYFVMADSRALDHVLVNLIDNAVKYSESGGRVDVRARATEDWIRVTVTDEGPGISQQHRERVFERFYRVDSGRARSAGGTGLGLSIVRHLVNTMGGEVGVEAGEPRGSVFWFTLPRRSDALRATARSLDGASAEVASGAATSVEEVA